MNSIEIQMPKGENGTVSCLRVGRMYNGEFVLESQYQSSRVELNDLETAKNLEAAARSLSEYAESGDVKEVQEDGTVLFDALEQGIYLIQGSELGKMEMKPTLVFVPTWMEDEQTMQSDITVIPKLESRPQMGDENWGGIALFYIISFLAIFLILLRCRHLRKKKDCDTMQES